MTVQARVHHLVASHLHIAEAAIEDRHTALDNARTIGDLVALVDDWLAGDRPVMAQTAFGASCA